MFWKILNNRRRRVGGFCSDNGSGAEAAVASGRRCTMEDMKMVESGGGGR